MQSKTITSNGTYEIREYENGSAGVIFLATGEDVGGVSGPWRTWAFATTREVTNCYGVKWVHFNSSNRCNVGSIPAAHAAGIELLRSAARTVKA